MDFNLLNNMDASEILTELSNPAEYRGYLQVMTHFSDHSWRNIFLIYKQMPRASKLADFDTWKKQYGRTMKPGITSIKIILHSSQKPKSLMDISQTEGAPVPILAGDVMSDEALRGAFADVLKMMSPLSEKPDFHGIIRQIICDRLGELRDNFAGESVTHVVCRRFGVEAEADFTVLAPDALGVEMLENIVKNTHELITSIEEKFVAVCEERGIEPTTLSKAEPKYARELRTETAAVKPREPPILKHPPDPEITIAERNQYGYTRPELLPLTKEKAIAFFRRDMRVYLLRKDNTEAMARYVSDIETHGGIFGIAYGAWQNSREYLALASGDPEAQAEAKFIYDGGDSFAVYQVKDEDSPMLAYKKLQEKGLAISRHDYSLVYTAPLPPSDTPEGIFMWVNAKRLDDYGGRALDTSDVLSIKKGGVITSYYVNERTFKELLSFIGEEERKAEIAENEPVAVENFESKAALTLSAAETLQPQPQAPLSTVLPDSGSETAVYRLSAKEAKKHGAMDAYDLSRRADIDCANAISEAIEAHKKDGNRYDLATPAENLLILYGAERMTWVLAKHIVESKKPFSQKNHDWAAAYLNDGAGRGDKKPTFSIGTHHAVLNVFVKKFRGIIGKKPTFSERMAAAKKKSEAHNNS